MTWIWNFEDSIRIWMVSTARRVIAWLPDFSLIDPAITQDMILILMFFVIVVFLLISVGNELDAIGMIAEGHLRNKAYIKKAFATASWVVSLSMMCIILSSFCMGIIASSLINKIEAKQVPSEDNTPSILLPGEETNKKEFRST